MLFTWETKNLCIVFRQWRITTFFSLVLSLIAIVLLVAGYECIREISRRVEQGYNEGGLGMFRPDPPGQPVTETVKANVQHQTNQAHCSA